MTSHCHPFTVEDLYDLAWLEDAQISPDGQHIAVVQVAVDRRANAYQRSIYVIRVDGGPLRRFTVGNGQDRQPRWSPDGRTLAFVSTRDNPQGQIYRIRLDGGEAQCLTALPNGASDPVWSPDGRMLACLSSVNVEERSREENPEPTPPPADAWAARRAQEEREHAEAQRFDPRVITKLPYRSGTSYFDDRHRHIYVLEVPDGDVEAPPTPRRITQGDLHHSAPTWMPDGLSLLTTASRDPDADSLFAYEDVLRVPVDGGPALRLTTAGYTCLTPQPAPDGSQIAFRRIREDRLLADGAHVAVMPAAGGPIQEVTGYLDRNVDQFAWHPDGQSVYLLSGWHGAAQISSSGLPATSTFQQDRGVVGGTQIISEFSVARDGTLAWIAGSAAAPCNLFVRLPDGSERQLTQINQHLLDQRSIAPFEELRYTASDGAEVQGWVLYPPDFEPTKPAPLVVHIHGGPHVMWGPGYRSMWHEWQTIAASGYICFFCNPRGSEGYGTAWREAIAGNWGYADQGDIHAGIDALIARGHVDTQRIAVTGGSYGGYMTAWLISQSDRFCCAVAARGVYNLLTEHSTSDAHELIEHEFHAYPWENAAQLWAHSPLAHAHQITTPLLLLHSEQDYRVPISEAEQLFAILRRQKKIVELVRYPREGHELTRAGEPHHRADHLRRTLAWFHRYCQETSS